VLGKTYPDPIIDVAGAARMARDRIFAMRRSVDRTETQRVIHKHASRKDSAGHFVNDRAPRKPRRATSNDAQLKLDL
jgi:deoxyribodipyrimidine photo-lyase